MSVAALQSLNILIFVVHTGLVLFNAFGWMHPRTRRWNFVCLAFTFASWVAMGIWFGGGTCILTEWHWQVRAALGLPNRSDNYVSFLLETLTPFRMDPESVRAWSAGVFLFSLVMSTGLNLRDRNITAPRWIGIRH